MTWHNIVLKISMFLIMSMSLNNSCDIRNFIAHWLKKSENVVLVNVMKYIQVLKTMERKSFEFSTWLSWDLVHKIRNQVEHTLF